MPDDLRDFVLPKVPPMAADEARFALDPAVVALPFGERPEPTFDAGPQLIGFDEAEPAEPAPPPEPLRLDPERARDEPGRLTAVSQSEGWLVDIAAALGVHLLSLLLFLSWDIAPAEIPPPIPVQLVIEQPPPPPPPPPPEPPKPPVEAAPPPPGRLASVDIGGAGELPKAADKSDSLAEAPPKPVPPPKPGPPPALVSALPKVVAPPQPDLKPAEPPPAKPEKPPIKPAAAARPAPAHHPGHHPADIPGPDATRDEYLAYCMSLVRQHYGVLPASFLAGRRGLTVLKILVLGDGTIARIEIAHPSGYPDIDGRVEKMISEVRRFPPLPQWIQRSSITLNFELAFPQGLLEQ